ncbi:MAG: selenoneine synthase SenA [Vicinamibacteria bacterium]
MPEATLARWTIDARQRTFDLIEDLEDQELMGPRLAIVNPLLWEIGHVAWFQEKWVLRHVLKEAPIRDDCDLLYDSSAVPHDLRWHLPLPRREETMAYMREVRDRVLDRLARPDPDSRLLYFARYAIHHEDMHDEAFAYTRQTLGYRPPPTEEAAPLSGAGPLPGDVEVDGGRRFVGATDEDPFVFDNEKWAHGVDVAPFAIARAPVTQAEFAAFVEDSGYRRLELWDEDGWTWRSSLSAEEPFYWRRAGTGWERRDFDRFVPLEPHRPVLHVNWHEARAYCRWAGRRLPAEAEWETAASLDPAGGKRRFPWGDEPPGVDQAQLDARILGCADVAAHPEGDSPVGCRQMIGNVWEWCQDAFLPYPGFVPDAYRDYSQPWFGTHRVLRGGCWVTRARLLRNTWRNFYPPDRRDVWAGFRTCALR